MKKKTIRERQQFSDFTYFVRLKRSSLSQTVRNCMKRNLSQRIYDYSLCIYTHASYMLQILKECQHTDCKNTLYQSFKSSNFLGHRQFYCMKIFPLMEKKVFILSVRPGSKWSAARYQMVHGPISKGPRLGAKWSATRYQIICGQILNGSRYGTKWSADRYQMVCGSMPNGPGPDTKQSAVRYQMVRGTVPNDARHGIKWSAARYQIVCSPVLNSPWPGTKWCVFRYKRSPTRNDSLPGTGPRPSCWPPLS